MAIPELAPWRARFDFLVYGDTDQPAGYREYVLAGFALERVVTGAEANDSPDTARLHPRLVRQFSEDVFLYSAVAELKLRFEDEKAGDLHARLVHGDLEVFARAYRNLAGVQNWRRSLALLFDIDETTVWRWQNRAVQAGLLDESEVIRRKK